jgi:hypothetical protein
MKSDASMRWALALVAVLCVAGCGGGGGAAMDDPPDASGGGGTPVPLAAGQSSSALVRFLKGLVADETGEPMQVGAFEPPTADAAEPEGID